MFYAPVIMYMGIWDREPDRAKESEEEIKKHVEEFVAMTKTSPLPDENIEDNVRIL